MTTCIRTYIIYRENDSPKLSANTSIHYNVQSMHSTADIFCTEIAQMYRNVNTYIVW